MQPRLARALFALAFVLITAAVVSCSSSSNNSTSPTPPVTGPTFSFAFPAAGTFAVPGTSNQRTFTNAEVGVWTYHCIPHQGSGMTGTVVVDAGAADDTASVKVGADSLTANALRFSPPTVRIRPGGHVRWYNVSSMTIHTVTRP